MSSFITRMPVDLEAFKKLLPNGSDFEGVAFNAATNEVELRWSNRYIVTPYSNHTDFTHEMLETKEIPKCAHLREDAFKSVSAPAPEPAPIVVDKKARRGVKRG